MKNTYNKWNKIETSETSDGKNATTEFDDLGNITSVAENGVVKETYAYNSYDSMGNICEVLENGLTVAKYEYDMLGRLIREDNRKFARTSIYTYDYSHT